MTEIIPPPPSYPPPDENSTGTLPNARSLRSERRDAQFANTPAAVGARGHHGARPIRFGKSRAA